MGISKNLFYTQDPDSDTLYRRVIPTDEQFEYIQENWRHLADHLKGAVTSRLGIPTETWIQGSYKFGTLIRPVSPGMEFDVDLGLYLLPSANQQAQLPSILTYRRLVRNIMEAYAVSDDDAKSVATPSKERCERLHYNENFHIDVPSYKLIGGLHLLARLPDEWEESNPRTLYLWFRNLAQNCRDGGQLRRQIQYLKNWACQKFQELDKGFQPSSIMLTVVASQAYVDLPPNGSQDEDEVFAALVSRITSRLNFSSAVSNPVDASENLNRLTNDGTRNLIQKLEELATNATLACSKQSRFSAALIWEREFGHFFPVPADEYSTGQGLARLLPEVQISELYAPSRGLVQVSVNSISRVQKDRILNFKILNSGLFPLGCRVEWMVRNAGNEALNINDLGHKASGIGLYEHDEHTSYAGTHFMDCAIYDARGELYSYRRIPVGIQAGARANSPGYYRKFASRRR